MTDFRRVHTFWFTWFIRITLMAIYLDLIHKCMNSFCPYWPQSQEDLNLFSFFSGVNVVIINVGSIFFIRACFVPLSYARKKAEPRSDIHIAETLRLYFYKYQAKGKCSACQNLNEARSRNCNGSQITMCNNYFLLTYFYLLVTLKPSGRCKEYLATDL